MDDLGLGTFLVDRIDSLGVALRTRLVATVASHAARPGNSPLGGMVIWRRLVGAVRRAGIALAPLGISPLLGTHDAARNPDAGRRAAHRAWTADDCVFEGASAAVRAPHRGMGIETAVAQDLALNHKRIRGMACSCHYTVGMAYPSPVSSHP